MWIKESKKIVNIIIFSIITLTFCGCKCTLNYINNVEKSFDSCIEENYQYLKH